MAHSAPSSSQRRSVPRHLPLRDPAFEPEVVPLPSPEGSGAREKPRSILRRSLLLLSLAAGLALACYVALRIRAGNEVEVTVVPAEQGRIAERISAVSPGRVSAERELVLRAPFGGKVYEVHHRIGDHVAAGDLLVSFETDELKGELRAVDRALGTARAVAAEARLSAQLSRSRERRSARLSASETISKAEAEGARFESQMAAQSARAAGLRAEEQAERQRAARRNLARAELRAPFDGVILTLGVRTGDAVQPGEALLTLADATRLHVKALVDEVDVGRLRVGMPVELGFDDQKIPALRRNVTTIEPSVTTNEHGSRVVGIVIDLPADSNLRVGMGIQVDVVVAERTRAVLVPFDALQEVEKGRELLVVVDGVVTRRHVELGIQGWDTVEVKKGVSAGEVVVVSSNGNELAEGSKVQVRSRENAGSGAANASR